MANPRSSSDPNLGVSEIPVSHSGIRINDDESRALNSGFWRTAEGESSISQLMFEKHPQPMWICDALTLRFIDVNDSALEHYGYEREEFLDKTLLNIQVEPVMLRRRAPDNTGASGVGRHSYWRHARKDGSTLLVEACSSVVHSDGRQVIVMAMTDVTELFETEEDVRRLAAAIEQTAESIMISDTTGTLTYVNPAFERITGYSRQEIIGQNARVLKSGQHPPEFYQRIWGTLAEGHVWSGQIINKRKNGTFYPEEMTISPVRDSRGKIISYVAVKRDVTRELALEEQLRQSQKMEAVGHLAGGIAHDFNNLLTVIHGNASLLQDDPHIEAARVELVRDIVGAAERAAGFTRQLLVVSRKQAMKAERLDLNETMESLARMLQRVIGDSITLRCTYAPELPRVNADRGMLQQVLLNLVLNARDAMPDGGILLIRTSVEVVQSRYELDEAAEASRHVCIYVTDTGCGIPAENLSRIFDPFFTTKEVGKGTGLGLATVYSIVKQHRGWVETTSTLDHGTTFRVYIPAASSDSYYPKAEPSPSVLPRGRETILVVEDDPPVRRTLSKLLERCGYTVLQADSGISALSIWEIYKDQIKLLLTDVMMPGGLLGPQLALRLRAEKPELKVVFTSGYDPNAIEGSSLLGENIAMLHKPWRHQDVAETLRACLDQAISQNQISSDREK